MCSCGDIHNMLNNNDKLVLIYMPSNKAGNTSNLPLPDFLLRKPENENGAVCGTRQGRARHKLSHPLCSCLRPPRRLRHFIRASTLTEPATVTEEGRDRLSEKEFCRFLDFRKNQCMIPLCYAVTDETLNKPERNPWTLSHSIND